MPEEQLVLLLKTEAKKGISVFSLSFVSLSIQQSMEILLSPTCVADVFIDRFFIVLYGSSQIKF